MPSSRRGHGDNVVSMAWNPHAIAQTQLRKHVASTAWSARNLISTQVAARQTLDRHPGVGVYTCKVQSLALLAKGTTLAAFEAGSSFVLEHFGDEGAVWVASTAPPEEPRSPSPRPRSPTHLL